MKPEINSKRNDKNYASMWKFNNTFLNNQWTREEIKEDIRQLLKLNGNSSMAHQS